MKILNQFAYLLLLQFSITTLFSETVKDRKGAVLADRVKMEQNERWIYNDIEASKIANEFNSQYSHSTDEYAPKMVTLKQQNDLKTSLDVAESFNAIFIFIFIKCHTLYDTVFIKVH